MEPSSSVRQSVTESYSSQQDEGPDAFGDKQPEDSPVTSIKTLKNIGGDEITPKSDSSECTFKLNLGHLVKNKTAKSVNEKEFKAIKEEPFQHTTSNSIHDAGFKIVQNFQSGIQIKTEPEDDDEAASGHSSGEISDSTIKVVHSEEAGNVYMMLDAIEPAHNTLHSEKNSTGKRPQGRPKTRDAINVCPVCHKTYVRPASLKLHMMVHTGEKPHKCSICESSFAQATSLRMHMLLHTGEKPFECKLCNKNFRHRNTLLVHERTHTGERPHQCTVCGKCFTQSNKLTRHMYSHTGERPYKCTMCDKSFTQNDALKLHFTSHTGEKHYSCKVCHTNFRHPDTLRSHMMTHTGEKPFNCPVCGLEFRQRGTMMRHAKRHPEYDSSMYLGKRKHFKQRWAPNNHTLTHSEQELINSMQKTVADVLNYSVGNSDGDNKEPGDTDDVDGNHSEQSEEGNLEDGESPKNFSQEGALTTHMPRSGEEELSNSVCKTTDGDGPASSERRDAENGHSLDMEVND